MSRTFADAFADALKAAARAYDADEPWPAALLWPDPDRQFASAFPELRARLAPSGVTLVALGPHVPEDGTGPAIWIRCLVEADLPGKPPAGNVVVVLLPDIDGASLRRPEGLPDSVKPLVDLGLRGDLFRNRRQARDWTVGSLLRSADQGPGLDMGSDPRTDEAAAVALPRLLDQPVGDWKGRRIQPEEFHRLLETDETVGLLDWIGDPDAAREKRSPKEWESFRALVKAKWNFDVTGSGSRQKAVERLAAGEGAWAQVRRRLEDTPRRWAAACEQLRKAETTQGDFLTEPTNGTSADNRLQEKLLEGDLKKITTLAAAPAREAVRDLEKRHAARRKTLWGRLGEAPLAHALEPLARLADRAGETVPGGDVVSLATAWADTAWLVEDALLASLAAAGAHLDLVAGVVRTFHLPWVDDLARRFATALEAAGAEVLPKPLVVEQGTMVLFVDGLRLDVGRRLAERLTGQDSVQFAWRLAPTPTVTATAKPLVTPIAKSVGGAGNASDFLPLEISSGKPATTDVLRAAMRAQGVRILGSTEVDGPTSKGEIGWSECGNLDAHGHAVGLDLAAGIEREIDAIVKRVGDLRAAGWRRVRLVTDHGWLLVPGGLPKVDLPTGITASKWSRAAVLQSGAAPEKTAWPWYWDKDVRIVTPQGAGAFRAGEVYSHGGISLQECVIPDIIVGDTGGVIKASGELRITSLFWKRWKLSVTLSGPIGNHQVEVRGAALDPGSRISTDPLASDDARLDFRVDPDTEEETPVFVVLIDAHGGVVDHHATLVGDRS